MKHAALAFLLAVLLSGQTRVHGPTQVRYLASGNGAVSWYYGSLSFGTLAAGQCAELSFPAQGVSPGLALAPGWPPDLPKPVSGIMYAGSDAVVVRLCAVQNITVPPGLTYSAAALVWR
jgi:hypothetical protein